VLLAAAVVCVPLAKKLGLGSVLGYLLAGVLVGPFGLGFVGGEGRDLMHVAEFGVVMMLFLVGLELEPRTLWQLRSSILGLGGLQVTGTAIVLGLAALALGQTWREGVALGLILAMSSTAIVLQALAEKGWLQTAAGRSAFAVLLFQDISVIPILAVLPLLAAHDVARVAGEHGPEWLEALPVWGKTLAVLASVATVVLVGRYLARPLFRLVARTRLRELFVATALLLVVAITVLMTQVGLSPALGTFLAGVVLAGSEYRHELESDIEPFKGLLLGLFFLAVGATIDFRLVASAPGAVFGVVLGVMVLKAGTLLLLGRVFRMSLGQNLIFALGLSQVGEFAFVLFSLVGRQGILDARTTAFMTVVVAISMALTPLVFLAVERGLLPRLGTRQTVAHAADAVEEKNPVIIAGFGHFGSTIGRFMRANGVLPTVLESDSDRVELLRRMGFRVYYGDPTRYDLLEAAGAAEAKLLIIAIDAPEQATLLAELALRRFPHLHVLARAKNRNDAYGLMDLGLLHIYREGLDTSLRLGEDALRLLGHRAHRVRRAAQIFRLHDERALKRLAAVRQDLGTYVVSARESIEEQERLIQSDLANRALESDSAWDAESLRSEFA
jgi:CPA2 family monovalent cation:H+ antiporter-2/glutathione-regulated potassium-efflux system protein KefB